MFSAVGFSMKSFRLRMIDLVEDVLLDRRLHVAEVHEDARVGVGRAAEHDLEAVVVAVQVETLALVAGQPVRGGEGELGFDLMHGVRLLALGCVERQKGPGR